MTLIGIISWTLLISISWSSPQRNEVSIETRLNKLRDHPQMTGLRHSALNESATSLSETRLPRGLIIDFYEFSNTLRLDPIYRVAIVAMYQLSLQPWESHVKDDLEFTRPPFDARIIIPDQNPLPPGYTFPYSWAISGLYEGMIHLEQQADRASGHIHELRVDLKTRIREFIPTPVAYIKFLHASFPESQNITGSSGEPKLANETSPVLHNSAGEYTDPADQSFRIRWRSRGPISRLVPPIYPHDVYLAAIDGIDTAARFPAESPCWWLHGEAPRRATRSPPTITITSGGGLTHRLAARTMLLLTRIMEDNAGYVTETRFDLSYNGWGVGTGSIEPYYEGTPAAE